MKFHLDKKKVMTKVYVLIVLIIILFAFLLFSRPKNCGSDESCFINSFIKCSKAKASLVSKDGNNFNFEIKGSNGKNCIVDAKLISMSESKTYDIRAALEGKSMMCSIPSDIPSSITQLDNINEYCTGQLKEATLQVSVEKMYEILVRNVGPLASEFRNVLKK